MPQYRIEKGGGPNHQQVFEAGPPLRPQQGGLETAGANLQQFTVDAPQSVAVEEGLLTDLVKCCILIGQKKTDMRLKNTYVQWEFNR